MSFVSLSDKVQTAPIKRDLIQWCPTMDLLAMISDSDEVFLNRLSGQRVWSVNPALTGQEAEVPVSLTWRPDGKVLALGLADGSLHCLDLNDGRTIDCLRKQGTIQNDSTALLKWLQRDSNKKRTSTRQLILDVRSQLPVLAPIPSSSTERVYTDAESIRTLIHDLEGPMDTTRLMITSSDVGSVLMLVGAMQLSLQYNLKPASSSVLLDHCSTKDLDTHALIHQIDGSFYLGIYTMDIFAQNEAIVSDMVRSFNDFHAVSAYLSESLAYIREEYSTLQETRNPSFDKLHQITGGTMFSRDLLFQFLLTGAASPTLVQWLDNVNERLIKRWEKSCQVNLLNIAKVVEESSIQACNRLIIMLDKFRTMSIDPVSHNYTKFESAFVVTTLKSLELLVAQLKALLRAINVEVELFPEFCQWLCFAVARMPEEDETPQAIMPVSTQTVARYIEEHLVHNNVSGLLDAKSADINLLPFLQLEKDVFTLDAFPVLVGPDTPTIYQTHNFIESAKTDMFAAPAENLTKQWHTHGALLLSNASTITCSIHVTAQEGQTFYTSLTEHNNHLETDCIYMVKTSNPRSMQTEICKIIPVIEHLSAFIVQDIKFIDDVEIIILLQSTGEDKTSHLLAVEYTALEYTLHKDTSMPVTHSASSSHNCVPSKHRALDAGVHPVSLAVNGRKGRRTGVYLQADRQRYTIFDLDDQADDDGGDDSMDEMFDE